MSHEVPESAELCGTGAVLLATAASVRKVNSRKSDAG
jgi:hypothetical protein